MLGMLDLQFTPSKHTFRVFIHVILTAADTAGPAEALCMLGSCNIMRISIITVYSMPHGIQIYHF